MALSDTLPVITYTTAQLRQFLELWQIEGGVLSLDQMEALVEWPETPEVIRQQLTPSIEERYQSAPPIHTIPLTPAEEEYVREHGLLDDPSDDKRPDA